jgi:hypothetical protein
MFYRPDHGDALPGFLAKHVASFPPWLKLVATVRTQLQEVARQIPLNRIRYVTYFQVIQYNIIKMYLFYIFIFN